MSTPISATTRARFGASIVALAPAVMLVGLFAHPYIAILPHRDPSRRGGGRRDGHGRHDALGAGAPNGRGGIRAAGSRLPRTSEPPAGGG